MGRRRVHPLRHRPKPHPLRRTGPPRRRTRQKPIELKADLQQAKLADRVNVGNYDPASRQNDHQPLPRQTLQRLTNRRPPDPQAAAEHRFRYHGPRRDAQRDDLLLQRPVRFVRQRVGLLQIIVEKASIYRSASRIQTPTATATTNPAAITGPLGGHCVN